MEKLYPLDKMLILEGDECRIRSFVDCPEVFSSSLKEALLKATACRVEQQFFDRDGNYLASRYRHYFQGGDGGQFAVGAIGFQYSSGGITFEVGSSSPDYDLIRKAEFARFSVQTYEVSALGHSMEERLSKLEYFVHSLWHCPGMPGMIQAQSSFASAVAAS